MVEEKFIIDKGRTSPEAGASGRVQSGHDPEPCEERGEGKREKEISGAGELNQPRSWDGLSVFH